MARGCRIERKVCEEYGVKILYPDFLDEPEEELVRTPIKLEKPVLKWDTTSKPLTEKEIEDVAKAQDKFNKIGIHDSVTFDYGVPREATINGEKIELNNN